MMVLEVRPMTQHQISQPSDTFDVAVIGGGAAGLNAALVLARARRAVVVIDAGAPRNAPAAGVHGFLTRDGTPPAELLAIGRQEVERYGGAIMQAQAEAARRIGDLFDVTLADGRTVTARRLIVTTGLADEIPEIAGLRERWGHDVLHCPYCHGWEFRDQPIGIVATDARALHQASLFRQWTSDLVLFTHTGPALTDEQAEELAARGVRVVPGIVEAVEVADDRLAGVRLHDGTRIARRALVVAPRFVARSEILAGLGLHATPHPAGVGERIVADPTGRTEVPGVWVAGNVTDLMAQVVTSAAGGAMAGAAVNADLIAEETSQAVAAYRAQPTTAYRMQSSAASETIIARAS
jgi:thioredoxin reductase